MHLLPGNYSLEIDVTNISNTVAAYGSRAFVQDASGKVLASSQGSSDEYYRWDPIIAFKAPADGEYSIWFRDLNWRGELIAARRI